MNRQELYCHGCDQYVTFEIDKELSGELTVICPNCGHEHYRKVVDGEITEERWASSGGNFITTGISTSVTSNYFVSTANGQFMNNSWNNSAYYGTASTSITFTTSGTLGTGIISTTT